MDGNYPEFEDTADPAIARLIEAGAMRLCPRCQYIPRDRDETIFEPLRTTSRIAQQYADADMGSQEVAMTVLTLVCTHCGYLIEHCVDYLEQVAPPMRWQDYMYVGLGADPDYDVLEDVARLLQESESQ
jgi:hypothetical protein